MKFVGIDPGASGALAVISDDGSLLRFSSYSEITPKEIFTYLSNPLEHYKVVLEKLWGMPLRGSQGNWSLGANYGGWQVLLTLAGVSVVEVTPQNWQKQILHTTSKKGKKGVDTKQASLAYVNKRYPEMQLPCKKISDINFYSGISDAICMALYCRHLHLNVS